MASRALTPLLRRSVVHARTKALRGGGSPPMPAFARIPAPSEPVSYIDMMLLLLVYRRVIVLNPDIII